MVKMKFSTVALIRLGRNELVLVAVHPPTPPTPRKEYTIRKIKPFPRGIIIKRSA
jgi:hypothetical protein